MPILNGREKKSFENNKLYALHSLVVFIFDYSFE